MIPDQDIDLTVYRLYGFDAAQIAAIEAAT